MIQKMVKRWKNLWTKSTLLGIVLGQILSLLITSVGFTSSQLAKKGVDAPFSLCFLNYVLLTLVYGSIFLYRKEPLKAKFYHHIMLALVDVLAKFHVVTAYQHTYLTSVTLLDCWTIPCVMFLTWLFFKTKCELRKLVVIIVCVAGLITVVFSDVHFGDRSSGSNLLRGDLAIIVGATLYGVSNIYKEVFVKNADHVELMAWLGYNGAIFSFSAIYKYESNEYKSILSSPGVVFLFIGFSLAMFLFYSGVPLLLKISGSTMLSLSLLTSNMWVVLIRIFGYHEKVNWIYFVAFVAVTLELAIYLGGDEMDPNNVKVIVDPSNGEAAAIDDEIGLGEVAATDDLGGLGHSENLEISNNDGSMISFQGARNSLRHIIINIHVRNVRE